MIEKPKYVIAFIPALNEEEKIGEVIKKVYELYQDSEDRGFKIEVIVIDDGSTDKTVNEAESAGVKRIVSHPYNLGLGAATRTGMQTAYEMGADVALKLDADFQHDPQDIEKVIQPVLQDRADIVYGSRFGGKINYKMPFIRKIGNLFFTWLMRKVTGWKITDAQTGLMVYSRKYLANFNMPGNYNPPHQTLIDAYHKHMRYMEVPVVFHPRTSGKSFVSLKYPFKAFPQILRTLIMVNPLKVFMPLGLFLIFCGVGLCLTEWYLLNQKTIDALHDGAIAVLIIFGIQTTFFGLLADLIVNKK